MTGPKLRRFPAQGEAKLDGWLLVQEVAGPNWPSEWLSLITSSQPGSPDRYVYVWRATARAPGRGTVEWRWDPRRQTWDCRLEFPIRSTPAEVANLWRDGFALFTNEKNKYPRPGLRKGSSRAAPGLLLRPEEARKANLVIIEQARRELKRNHRKISIQAIATRVGRSPWWVKKWGRW